MKIEGMLRRAIAIIAPGIFLSQPPIASRASTDCAWQTVSIASAITSRETREDFIPSVPCEMPSLTVIVPNVCGIVAFCRRTAAARSARRFKPALQGVTVLYPLATPMIGFSKSPSLKPTARSIARFGVRSTPFVIVWLAACPQGDSSFPWRKKSGRAACPRSRDGGGKPLLLTCSLLILLDTHRLNYWLCRPVYSDSTRASYFASELRHVRSDVLAPAGQDVGSSAGRFLPPSSNHARRLPIVSQPVDPAYGVSFRRSRPAVRESCRRIAPYSKSNNASRRCRLRRVDRRSVSSRAGIRSKPSQVSSRLRSTFRIRL